MEPNIDEILRYLRVRGESPEDLRAQVETTARELAESLPPKFVYRAFPLEFGADGGAAVLHAGDGI